MRPIDPLAMDMYAQRIGNILLPGVTGRTFRSRYMGMVCAGLRITSDHASGRSSTRIVEARRNAFLPFERGWALAVCHHANGQIKERNEDTGRAALTAEFQGFRGANHVLSYWRQSRARDSWVIPSNYELLRGQSSQGGLGSYLVTLVSGGFIDPRTLSLREPGQALAEAFLGNQSRQSRRLPSGDRASWRALSGLGAELDLRRNTAGERAILEQQIFNPTTGSLAPAMRGLTLAGTDNAETALTVLSKAKDQELTSVAEYALKFDPFRGAALACFGGLGRSMEVSGELPTADIPDDVESSVAQLRRSARALCDADTPDGLHEIRQLALRIEAASGTLATIDQILDWHRDRRAAWIVRDGSQFKLGRKGNFDLDTSFHGYTVASFFSLLDDLRRPIAKDSH